MIIPHVNIAVTAYPLAFVQIQELLPLKAAFEDLLVVSFGGHTWCILRVPVYHRMLF